RLHAPEPDQSAVEPGPGHGRRPGCLRGLWRTFGRLDACADRSRDPHPRRQRHRRHRNPADVPGDRMSILAKIFTLFRGTANEAGQAVVDKNAIRILDQELRDSTSELAKSKDELTKVMAQRQLSANRGSALLAKRREYEGYVKGALGKGDEALAREVAVKL